MEVSIRIRSFYPYSLFGTFSKMVEGAGHAEPWPICLAVVLMRLAEGT